MDLTSLIRNVPDFPKPGIQFKDITTLLKDPAAFRYVIDEWKKRYADQDVHAIVGTDARGFIFAAALAYAMDLPFIPVRKKGKLPAATESQDFKLEYGSATLEIHTDALNPGDRIVIVDDLLATGGTLGAVCALCQRLQAEIIEIAVVIELPPLGGRALLGDYPVHSLVTFNVE